MKREIKFRAWDIEEEEMIFKAVDFELRCLDTSISSVKWHGNITPQPNNDRFELMQFTGLTDKNGVEIYEGDICKDVYNNQLYYFDWRGVGYGVSNLGNRLSTTNPTRLEVIGNIHENPDLL